MKFIVTLLCIIFAYFSVIAQNSDDILGIWLVEEKTGKVEIYKQEGKYFGKLVWIKNYATITPQEKLDKFNPDPKLRNREKLGIEIVKNLVYEDEEWIDGTIYDSRDGKIYSVKVTLANKNQLDIRGYIGIPLFGKTTKWTRVQ